MRIVMRRSIDRLGVPITYPWYESLLPHVCSSSGTSICISRSIFVITDIREIKEKTCLNGNFETQERNLSVQVVDYSWTG